jgi:hypothetical protein
MAPVFRVKGSQVSALEVGMKKLPFVFPFAFLLVFLGMPEAASAKSPTVKIVISGGGLTNAIEVTDPRILDISNVWTAARVNNFETGAHGI